MLSDAEVICQWMEPKPKTICGSLEHTAALRSIKWWIVKPRGAHLGEPVDWTPCLLGLDRLHEIEAKLSEEQWLNYVDALITLMPKFPRKGEIVHASAEQKIKALAAVLRAEVKDGE